MSNWDSHTITLAGPMEDIQRCAADYAMRPGKLDPETHEVNPAYGGQPYVDFGPGRYYALSCRVGVCDIEIELEAAAVEPMALYHEIRVKYPTLHVVWRYWLEMDWGVGYIDDVGDHRWHEETEDNFVPGPWPAP